jgi:FlaA1/EpsC-like NDP-sugar epimerase
VTFTDLVALLRAALLSLAVIVVIDHFVFPHQIPRAVVLLDFVITIVMFGGVRASGRIIVEHIWPAMRRTNSQPALLVGVDRSSGLLAHQMNSHSGLPYRIRGFLATSYRRSGRRIGQIPVLGHLHDVKRLAARHRVTDVLVIAGTLSGRRMRWLMETCEEAELVLKIIPPVEDLFNGGRQIPLRDLEIGDLLRRAPIELDGKAIAGLLRDRRVLVTGAGGSIGSEIVRQVLKFEPSELVLLGRGENRIFSVDGELRGSDSLTIIATVIADITDRARMRQVFERYRPEVVFHAAAHKHVPLMEANVGEAIKNNVLGTKCVADLADEYEVKDFVMISTDKAVNPSSVMGATKHVAERYVQALSQRSTTHFACVRFGNVLGSAGSVVPVFQEQIRRGGPITVTDPKMTRYFMTIPEAAQLVLQAISIGRGGEIFVLDMGQPVRIVDLARDLVRLSGLPPTAIDITYTGVRPGEKLHEELYYRDEQTLPTSHPKVNLAKQRACGLNDAVQMVARLERAIGQPDDVLRAELFAAIPKCDAPIDTPCDGSTVTVAAPVPPDAPIASEGHETAI